MYLLTVTLHTKLPTNDYLNNVPRHYVMLVTLFHPKNLLKLLVALPENRGLPCMHYPVH